jgi:hypothetical protein
MPIVFNNNETVDRFGELYGIYEHERVEGSGERAVFLDVRWLKTVKGMVLARAHACNLMRGCNCGCFAGRGAGELCETGGEVP